ncbi:2-phosphosulfolactate phosphatase [Methanobrevibacter filiformis]|uniref:2-phosphosulfolactate phosphatase n=1 Tax=Methanobrevibacter filiformis TaxID=55758 RepID=A0A166FID3_9EURY|nr:2-phosphosulfolactate phosphatase [Methanobrevibacter filiformis]KZX17704.1 putative 2-phosphosulfolactate phosphatase [Methanobrevibacter filiformis]
MYGGISIKISLSLEKTISKDISIMVDTFRASTSITMALDSFKEIIPAFTPEQAIEIAKNENAVLAGERSGIKVDGFDLGNSPIAIKNYNGNKDKLVLTTTNGTRIIENMKSTVLVGTLVNAEAVAKASLKLADKHIDVVMAGFKGEFSIEDYIGAGEILYQIAKLSKSKDYLFENVCNCDDEIEISEYAQTAILASRNEELVKKYLLNSGSSKRLHAKGLEEDVLFSINRNISDNVAIYEDKVLKRFI